MLVQDTLTGYLHEVPEPYGGYYGELPEFAEAPVVLDGFGYPMGLPFLPAIAGLAAKALPAVSGLVSKIPGVGGLVQGLIGGGARPPIPGLPALPGLPSLPGLPGGPPLPMPFPAGWMRPPLPYTGLGPRRMYMRCAVWPGPRGLVPASAAAMPPAVAAASPTTAAVVSPAGAAVAVRRRRFRRVR